MLEVARDCIGKKLVYLGPEGLLCGRIVEAEAYRGPEDRAAHSYGGRLTERTRVMFGPPGHAYVFLVYGLHFHFNIVTTAEGLPHAVLIRAVEPLEGVALMAEHRRMAEDRVSLTNGPGKLCQAFGIDRSHYGADLTRPPLYLAAGEPKGAIRRSPRVGVDYAGAWAKRPWRFYEAGNRWVSPVRVIKA